MSLKDSQAVGDLIFVRLSNCKYLGIYINQQTNSHDGTMRLTGE